MTKMRKAATSNAEEQKFVKKIVEGFKKIIEEYQVCKDLGGDLPEFEMSFTNNQVLILTVDGTLLHARLYYPTTDKFTMNFTLPVGCKDEEFKKFASSVTHIVMGDYLTTMVEETGLNGWMDDLIC